MFTFRNFLVVILAFASVSERGLAQDVPHPINGPQIYVIPSIGLGAADSVTATANTAFLQKALNAAGDVIVDCKPSSEFYTNSPVYISSNTRLELGAGCTWGQENGSNNYMVANAAVARGWTVLQNSAGAISNGPQALIWSASSPAWVVSHLVV